MPVELQEVRPLKRPLVARIREHKHVLLMCLPFVVWVAIFVYAPVWGWIMAFENYNPGIGIFHSEWVGLKYFIRFFQDPSFLLVMRNTLALSSLNIINFTVFPIVFAVLLNELRLLPYKKLVQTVSYLPHFVSYVVVSNIFLTLLSPSTGVVNDLLVNLGVVKTPINFFALPKLWWFLVAGINIWKEIGWSAIIYLAAIAGINPELYEAATIDGAGRFRRIWHITIPGMLPTIVVLFVLNIPDLLNAGFEPSYLLGNPVVSDHSEVLDLFIYIKGIAHAQYSFATAIGMMRVLLGLGLILGANKLARSVSDYGIF